jgi:hypothetical protein
MDVATEASQGWQAIEDGLRLSDWSKARRVVGLGRRFEHAIGLTTKGGSKRRGKREASEQPVLALPHGKVQDNAQIWEYAVLRPYRRTEAGLRLPTIHPTRRHGLAPAGRGWPSSPLRLAVAQP